MTIHLWLLSIVLLIPASVLMLTQLWRLGKRYPYPFLKPLFFFLLGTVVYFSLSFFPTYLQTNLPDMWDSIFTGPGGQFLLSLWVLVILALVICSAAFFVRTMEMLRGGKRLYWAEAYLALLATALLIFWLLRHIFTTNSFFFQGYMVLRLYPLRYFNLMYLILLVGLLFSARHSEDLVRARLARSFVFYFLIREVLDLLSTLSMDLLGADAGKLFKIIGLSGDVIYLALTVILAFLWMHRHLIPEQNREMNTLQTSHALAFLVSRHAISGREQEIVRLIISGKSNKEIGVLLKLSASTIKNHIYKIYQKMNINSRFELIDLVQQHEKAE